MKRQTLFLSVFPATMFALPALAADGVLGLVGVHW